MKAYDDGQAVIHLGDVRDVLRELPDQSAHMCVTSPPYWGLRDYGTAQWEGGDAECKHGIGEREPGDRRASTLGGGVATIAAQDSGVRAARETCGNCGAKRIDRQLGLETTPEGYVANMVDVFREVRRVLRDDGTLWLNIGDSYAASANTGGTSSIQGSAKRVGAMTTKGHRVPPTCKPKDLVGIPWMLAFALRADGWYLRSDIIWAKPNPMPESVTDRPTKAHEYLFLLSKRERYYYDADAIAERAVALVNRGGNIGISEYGEGVILGRATDPHSGLGRNWEPDGGRNKRTVWTIATQPYPEAHFATFPEALVEPCILAGSPSGGTVLEPFAGSGTTLAVAKRLGRRAIGIELNASYIDLARKRCAQMGMILEEPA